jgi:hypothetical protein
MDVDLIYQCHGDIEKSVTYINLIKVVELSFNVINNLIFNFKIINLIMHFMYINTI